MNNAKQWILGAVFFAMMATGCVLRSRGGGVNSGGGGGGGGSAVLRVVNNSGTGICYVRFSLRPVRRTGQAPQTRSATEPFQPAQRRTSPSVQARGT